MSRRAPMGVLACLVIGAACSPAADRAADSPRAAAGRAPLATWTVGPHGVGPLQVGTSVADAAAAIGAALALPPGSEPECSYAEWPGGPTGVEVMVEHDRVARVEVDSGEVATTEGARVGDSEARIRALYPGRVESTPHKYTDGRYLTIRPATPADSAYGLVFETDAAGRVTRYRAGAWPAVGYVEGCS